VPAYTGLRQFNPDGNRPRPRIGPAWWPCVTASLCCFCSILPTNAVSGCGASTGKRMTSLTLHRLESTDNHRFGFKGEPRIGLVIKNKMKKEVGMHKIVRGAIAGTVATIPMTLVMISLFRRLPVEQHYPLAPRLIIDNMAERAGVRHVVREPTLVRATLIAHFSYGAATGALFPFLEQHRYPLALVGPGYGLAVWAASYLGWIAALRILSPATHHPQERNVLMLAAHVVWGAALAGTSALLSLASNGKTGFESAVCAGRTTLEAR
jgi:hypothetical protein